MVEEAVEHGADGGLVLYALFVMVETLIKTFVPTTALCCKPGVCLPEPRRFDPLRRGERHELSPG